MKTYNNSIRNSNSKLSSKIGPSNSLPEFIEKLVKKVLNDKIPFEQALKEIQRESK